MKANIQTKQQNHEKNMEQDYQIQPWKLFILRYLIIFFTLVVY